MAETTGARRRTSARRSFSEHTLPSEYLERLEQKRKQLDESIHKYIASKEREYKSYERELKQEYKLAQGQDASQAVARVQADDGRSNDQNAALASERIAAVDGLAISPVRRSISESVASSGSPQFEPKDTRTPEDRATYLEGLFTPAYLSALDDKAKIRLERTLSDPPISTTSLLPAPHAGQVERANSDPFDQARPKRPSQLVLAQRTSSSGSSADGKLASAMRSPTHRPKHKRVSLAVGDSIVAPSDNVPASLTHNTTPSHSRRRSQVAEREASLSMKRSAVNVEEPQPLTGRAPSPLVEQVVFASEPPNGDGLPLLPPAAVEPSVGDVRVSKTPSSKIDADGDLFGLEDEELSGPQADVDELDDDSDTATESTEVIVGRIKSTSEPDIPPLASDGRTRYDPNSGIITEPDYEQEDSAVPYLGFSPSSSVGPREAGFRRPSVMRDPVYLGSNYQAAEQRAVENDVYGSSASRPKGSFTPGSLGESYMAKHAEEMMRARLAKRHTSVES